MKIRNKSGKIIGIGALALLPEQETDLPAGFESNPVILEFQEKDLVELWGEKSPDSASEEEKVAAEARAKTEAALADVEAAMRAKEDAEAARAKAEAEAARARAEAEAAVKAKERAEAAKTKAEAEAAKAKADAEAAKAEEAKKPEPQK